MANEVTLLIYHLGEVDGLLQVARNASTNPCIFISVSPIHSPP